MSVQAGETPGPSPGVPHRELRDPATLRALAHPVRLRLLDELAQLDEATATELAARIGESVANCSWHLRQLARHGFIEKGERARTNREHPWRALREGYSFSRHDDDPELSRAEEAAAEVILGRELEALTEWREAKRADRRDWRDAGFEFELRGWLTADELAAFRDEMDAVIRRHLYPDEARVDPASRPPGCRPIRLVAWAVPGPPGAETGAEASSPNEPDAAGDEPS